MKTKWSELALDMDEKAAAALEERLKGYAVPPAPARARESAVEAALRAMERQKGGWLRLAWEQVKTEARFLPYWYYLSSLLLAALGACLLLMNPMVAHKAGILMGMAPLPALLGLIELFHGADEGMSEIERACRFSAAGVLSARMLVVGLFSCLVSGVLGLCTDIASAWAAAGLVVIPFCLSTATGLILASVLSGRANSAQVALAVAFANGAAAVLISMKPEWLAKVAPPGWLGMMALSLCVLLAAVRGTIHSTRKTSERNLERWN